MVLTDKGQQTPLNQDPGEKKHIQEAVHCVSAFCGRKFPIYTVDKGNSGRVLWGG